MFLVLYKSTDSQTAHSKGYVGGSAVQSNSAFASYGNDYGMYGSTSSTTEQNAFFWLHNLWGNMYQFIASVFVRANGNSDKTLYHILGAMSNSSNWDNSSWNSTSNYALMTSLGTSTGSVGGGDGNPFTKAIGNNAAGLITASDSTAGSTSTYYPDNGYVDVGSSYAYFPRVGGYYNISDYAGVFGCYVYSDSTYSSAYYGSRLAYRGGRA